MSSPLVSIITNNYNCAGYLRVNVQSVLAQSYQNWEHIVIDAASTDDSLGVLEELKHPRLKVVRVPFCGVSESRNLGIEQANGELIAILDADDAAGPRRLQVQAQYMEDHPETSLVGSGMVRVDQLTQERELFIYPGNHEAILALLQVPFNCLPHSTVLYRRAAFDDAGRYSLAAEKSEDIDLALRLAKIGRLAGIPEGLVYYAYRRPGSHTEVHRPRGREALFYATLAVILDVADTHGLVLSRSAVEEWLDRVGTNGLGALQGRWAANAMPRALRRGDVTLIKYLGHIASRRLPLMAKYRLARWWRESATPRDVAFMCTQAIPGHPTQPAGESEMRNA